jgi:hypothetical protein
VLEQIPLPIRELTKLATRHEMPLRRYKEENINRDGSKGSTNTMDQYSIC